MAGGATGTGTVTLLAPVTNTNRTINLPDSNGTIVTSATAGVPIGGPAFSAYQSSAQTVSSSTFTLMQFQTEEFDTASAFNNTGSTVGSTPAYAFLPTVAGYYQFTAVTTMGAAASSVNIIFYKNGVLFKSGNYASGASIFGANSSALIYLNGTDYVQAYVLLSVGQGLFADSAYTYFQAAMVRSAV
jgi:hypothetical protein